METNLNAPALRLIEANAVIILHNPEKQQGETYAFWEFEGTYADLQKQAAQLSIGFLERCGLGHVQVTLLYEAAE